MAVLQIAVPILASLVVIRVAVRVLRVAFPQSQLVRVIERTISWLVWGALVLWITGLLPLVLAEMDGMRWKLGGADVSLRSLIEAALSAAGIPLGALSVMGGALGVGLGFGLQKLAANYVSGFVILAERSLRIGDMVKVDNFEGRVTDIRTRYTVVRALNGREAIVPNEMLITQRVENSSLADPKVAVSTTLQVAYGTDLDALMPRLVEVVRTVPRVLADPAPAVQLTGFGADGLDLSVGFWIGDAENGQGNVQSDVNLALLRTLNQLGISIPYPQRVLHRASAH